MTMGADRRDDLLYVGCCGARAGRRQSPRSMQRGQLRRRRCTPFRQQVRQQVTVMDDSWWAPLELILFQHGLEMGSRHHMVRYEGRAHQHSTPWPCQREINNFTPRPSSAMVLPMTSENNTPRHPYPAFLLHADRLIVLLGRHGHHRRDHTVGHTDMGRGRLQMDLADREQYGRALGGVHRRDNDQPTAWSQHVDCHANSACRP